MYGNESYFASPLAQKIMQVEDHGGIRKIHVQKAEILTKFYWGI